MKKNLRLVTLLGIIIFSTSCSEDDPGPELTVPLTYVSESYETNVVAEATVIDELAALTAAVNAAEENAQSTPVAAIEYPSNLQNVTLENYRGRVSLWVDELVKAANDTDGFQTPAFGETPDSGQEGGLLGERLLDENGLELEQMIQKGSFGSALYSHALEVIDGDLSSSAAIDKLVEIHGTEPTFTPNLATAAATYSLRRSNQTTRTGFFYDIQASLIAAKAAIEAGSEFDSERDEALADYLFAWEKSNFATVIYYCNTAKTMLQNATNDIERGDAMHAYAEGVAFARGFREVSNKFITDDQIDGILELLKAPSDGTARSYEFLNDANQLANFDQIIEDIQGIYGFTEEEVATFFVNNPS